MFDRTLLSHVTILSKKLTFLCHSLCIQSWDKTAIIYCGNLLDKPTIEFLKLNYPNAEDACNFLESMNVKSPGLKNYSQINNNNNCSNNNSNNNNNSGLQLQMNKKKSDYIMDRNYNHFLQNNVNNNNNNSNMDDVEDLETVSFVNQFSRFRDMNQKEIKEKEIELIEKKFFISKSR